MNYEHLIEALTCPLSIGSKKFAFHRHFLEQPKILPCCNLTVCNKCIVRHLASKRNCADFYFKCPFCEIVSRIKVINEECDLDVNIMAANQLERNFTDINHYLLKKLENNVKNIEGKCFEFKSKKL